MTNAPSKVSRGDVTGSVADGQKAKLDSLGQKALSLASKNKVVIAFFGVFAILILVGILTN